MTSTPMAHGSLSLHASPGHDALPPLLQVPTLLDQVPTLIDQHELLTTDLIGRTTTCDTNFGFHSAVQKSRPSSQNSSRGSPNTIPCPLESAVGGFSEDMIPSPCPLESAVGGFSTLIDPDLGDMLGLTSSDVAPVLNPVHEPSTFDEDFDEDFDDEDEELSAAGPPSAPLPVAQAIEILPPPKRRKESKSRHNLTERRRVERQHDLFQQLHTLLMETDPVHITRPANKPSKSDLLTASIQQIIKMRQSLGLQSTSSAQQTADAHQPAGGIQRTSTSTSTGTARLYVSCLPPCLPPWHDHGA